MLLAKHIPSTVNELADTFRWHSVQMEWMLCKNVFVEVLRFWGSPQLDMFKSIIFVINNFHIKVTFSQYDVHISFFHLHNDFCLKAMYLKN